MFFLLDTIAKPETATTINTYFTADTLCTIITVIGSVLTVSYTYYRTQKLKQFELFFDYKTRTYEKFWDAVSSYFDNPSFDNRASLRCALHRISLYSSFETYTKASTLVSDLIQKSNFEDSMSETSVQMRKDLEESLKGKLY